MRGWAIVPRKDPFFFPLKSKSPTQTLLTIPSPFPSTRDTFCVFLSLASQHLARETQIRIYSFLLPIEMDSFDEFDLALLDSPSPLLCPTSHSDEENDTMRQLVDADTRLSNGSYGGYCVIA
jgi:hypothetical protein